MGIKEEQMGKDMPGKVRWLLELFKSVLYAQNGTKAELQLEARWGGWLTLEGLSPMKTKKLLHIEFINHSYQDLR